MVRIGGDGGDGDDVAALLSPHDGKGCPDQAEGTYKIRLEVAGELLVSRFLKSGQQSVAGIIDQHVETTEPFDGFVHGALGIGGLGQVKSDAVSLSGKPGDQIGDALGVTDGQGDLVATVEGFFRKGSGQILWKRP